jgi:multiple sugar transport system substrate-binding protein
MRESRVRSEKSRRAKNREAVMKHQLTRRALLAAAGAGTALGALPVRVLAQDATTLDFVVWNYSLETIQDNIAKFEAASPGLKVKLTDYTWPDYFDTMVLRFRGSTPTHVIYCGEDWLPGWALAGWLVPIEEYFPEIDKYKDKVANYAIRDMTYKGKLYGLPYYADLITFQYNRKILDDHTILVPVDWDQVLDACLKLKQAGMEKPIVYEYNQTLPNFYQAYVSQVYGRGGQMFDADLNPLFNDPGSEAFKHLQWLQDAVTKHEIVAFENHESRVIPAMNTGKHAFSVLFNYVLAAMNERATQPLAGQFAMALMPGKAHACLGFCKFYAMTSQAAADQAHRDGAWKFIEFMGGGDYQVAKRWAAEKGLGFAQLPLFDDPDVQKAWSSWIDVNLFKQQAQLAINGTQTEWLGMWSGFFRPLMAKAFVGEASVAEVMDAGAARWVELRKLVRGS